MSRPPFQSGPTDDDPQRFPQMTPQMSPIQPPAMQADGASTPSLSLPPLRQLSNTPPTPLSDRRPGNPLGVRSILNPQADLIEQQRDRRRSGSIMETPSPVENQQSQNLPSISRPTSVDSTQGDQMPGRIPFQPPGRPPNRHMHNPRSPTMHRTQSLSVLNPPTGTIDAHASPFLSPSVRPMGSDPVTSQPALPTPPVGGRATYFPTVPPTAPTPPPGAIRNDFRRQSVSFPQSGSASPIPSFSPYSQPASVASSQLEAPSQQSSYGSMANNAHMQELHRGPMKMESERNRIPMAPTGQSSIQIMTIKSQQGHHVQIPVDVQAASKVADEKRKRNAGASARFRARRKEKEREASMSISRLETQLREALEDIDYYRNERDYFKSIVFQQPGAERHYARPPSPRLRRLSTAASNAPSSTTGGSVGSPYSGYEEDIRESDRNVRRRTSTYHPAQGPAPTPMNGSGPQPASYPTPSFAPVNAQPSHNPHMPGQRPLPELHQQGQRPPLHDPFAAPDPARYENRNWGPGPGHARDTRG